MDEARLREVLSDEGFVRELLAMESEEQVQAALEERGVELSLDEIRQVGEFVRRVQAGEVSQEQLQRIADGELTEDELEEVAGGISMTITIIALIFGGVLIVAGAGSAIGQATGW